MKTVENGEQKIRTMEQTMSATRTNLSRINNFIPRTNHDDGRNNYM
jgi:hypothetical protein